MVLYRERDEEKRSGMNDMNVPAAVDYVIPSTMLTIT